MRGGGGGLGGGGRGGREGQRDPVGGGPAGRGGGRGSGQQSSHGTLSTGSPSTPGPVLLPHLHSGINSIVSFVLERLVVCLLLTLQHCRISARPAWQTRTAAGTAWSSLAAPASLAGLAASSISTLGHLIRAQLGSICPWLD